MPSQEPRIFLELDDDDILNVMDHLNETYSITDDDSSFISNQPGPGRTLDNVISSMGRRLESTLNGISERFGNEPNAAMDRFRVAAEFDDEDILDVVNHLNLTHSITDAGSSFVSDQPSPGRTLDKALTIMGRRLENALSSISERFGNGPNTAMDRCLVAFDRALHPRYEWLDGPVHSSKFLRRPPPLDQLLVDVFSKSHRWRWVEMCEDWVFINSCQRLITDLRSDKSGNQLLATYYVTTLACCNPGILSHLVQLGAPKALEAMCLQQLLRRKDDRDKSLLLASSRRALVMFSDLTALPPSAPVKPSRALFKSRNTNPGCSLSDPRHV
ncbi:hypothetical protein JAAARDRAFT_198933 [Jaapia argillacea MUCL 33604]|uniref:Uncharacterized protein n=1 Tax=Jaapia argillacea MUCL 33604 TaxID=933084 RepID=A0A067PCW2_9AGAM|nr:hypothetical protein JAAARDRAFT_198933 [Jaapia argillacea MUCL 33604]